MSRWFRHYAGMAWDTKFTGIAVETDQSVERVLFVWNAILENAAEKNIGGAFVVSAKQIAYHLRCKSEEIEKILEAMEEASLIGSGAVVNWGKRQFESDKDRTNADRQARYKARHKETGNAPVTDANGSVTGGNAPVTGESLADNAPHSTESESESPFPNGKGRKVAPSNGHAKAPDAELYARGREVLGKKSGGMIGKLLTFCDQSIPSAMAKLDLAATKHDPSQYLGAIISNRNRGASGATDDLIT